MADFFKKLGVKKNLAPMRIPNLEISVLSTSLIFFINSEYLPISNEPSWSNVLYTIALTFEETESLRSFFIGLRFSVIFLSIQSCNFAETNRFFSPSKYSEFKISVFE